MPIVDIFIKNSVNHSKGDNINTFKDKIIIKGQASITSGHTINNQYE